MEVRSIGLLGSWCPDDIPAMTLYEQFRDHGVQFIGISFDTDREAWAKTLLGPLSDGIGHRLVNLKFRRN